MEEISRRQKAQALRLKEGKKCTSYFHWVANSHQRKNAIEMLHVDGQVLTDHVEIKDHITHFYEKLFIEQYNWRPRLDGLA